MTTHAPLIFSTGEVDPSRTCDFAADQAHAELAKVLDWLEAQPDELDLRIHSLFARLYLYDTRHWFSTPALDQNSDFLKLFVARFMDGYFEQVIGVVQKRDCVPNDNWNLYFNLTARLTMRSNIFSHLVVVITAFRTQICCDIPKALDRATKDYQQLFGRPVEIAENRALFFAPANQMVFQNAILEFIEFHQTHQSLFRRTVLSFFAKLLKMTNKIWWPVLNGWRKSSWGRFEEQITKESMN